MTLVADTGPVGLPSRSVPEPMRHRNFRLDDATWRDAVRIAELRDERISDVMRTLVKGYVAKHRKLLEADKARETSE